MLSPKQILKQYWGYESFRPPQEAIINEVLNKKDVIAILPTGSGKSVIYQVAGLALNGLTLVVSPLIALIEEQNATLNRRGIKSIALTGSLPLPDLERLLNNAQFGGAKFLFLSPERIQNPYVQKRLSRMDINLISIDEAHCISEWGHDFRLSYTKLSLLRDIIPQAPVLALTATAKQAVVDDIKTYLDLQKPVVFKSSVVRSNIAYKVIETGQKLNTLTDLLKKDTTAIVYVKTRKQTYQYAGYMAQQGFKTAFFHGGMSFKEKQDTLVNWLDNKTRIMFATTAFGMGIDKPDVRQVFHMDLPASLENYVQESGRAGRDGALSEAVILASSYDTTHFKENYLDLLPDMDFIHLVYKSLFNHFYLGEHEGKDLELDLNFIAFCSRFKLDTYKTLQALQILESEEILQVNQTRRFYASVKILWKQAAVRQYIAQKRAGYQILNHLIRSYTDIFYLDTKIQPKKIAQKLDINFSEVENALKTLHKRQIIDYKPAGDVFIIRFLESRDDHLFRFHQNHIEKRLAFKKEQLQKVGEYIQNKNLCRSQFLAQYFEENDHTACGICDICLQNNQDYSDKEILNLIKKLLQEQCLTATALQQHFHKDITPYLDKLVENQQINISNNFKYCINTEL